MADSIGTILNEYSFLDFAGASRFIVPGQSAGSLVWIPALGTLPDFAELPKEGAIRTDDESIAIPPICYLGNIDTDYVLEDFWFGLVIAIPRSFDFGNILTTQIESITLYSSYRTQDISLNTFVNNLGAGTSLTDLPLLPTTLSPQTGFNTTLQVTPDGPSSLNGTLDFIFDVSTQKVLITGQRIVMFPIRPQTPLQEKLEFKTLINEHLDGSEQRIAMRKNPRQSFTFKLLVSDDERQFFENLIFDWQSRVFGIPVWAEPTILTVDASIGETSITVEDTTLGDFREGGLVILFTDRNTFDVIEITTLGPQTIALDSTLNNDYPIGTEVMPLRTAVAQRRIRGSRSVVNDDEFNMVFDVQDNDVGDGYGDVSAFSSLDGKVFLDDPNIVDRKMSDSWERDIVVIDNDTGVTVQNSLWNISKRTSAKGFNTNTRGTLQEVRKLIHALKGKQTSFFMPTFFNDMELTSLLQSGTDVLNIINVGFNRFAQGREPSRNKIRVVLNDGTVYLRNILSSAEVDSLNEQITVDDTWPADIQLDEIASVEYIEKVRSASDSFNITHADALGSASLSFVVTTVFD